MVVSHAALLRCTPLSYTSSLILLTCSNSTSLRRTKQAHALATLFSLLPHHRATCAALMLSYAATGSLSSSRLLFDQISSPTTFLYNTLIRAYTTAGAHLPAFSIYNHVLGDTTIRPDEYTFPFILKACADVFEIRKGCEIHGTVLKLGFDRDVFVGNTLLAFYGVVMDLVGVRKVFDEMPDRDIISWNSVISVFLGNGCLLEAVGMFLELNSETELRPNSVSVVSVLPACAGLEDEKTVSRVHGYVVKSGLDSEVTVCNAIVDVYGKCGNTKASKRLFDGMVLKNVVSWNAIIGSFTHGGWFRDAVNMFRAMLTAEMKPNSITFSSVLPSLVELEFFGLGKEIHGYRLRMDMEFDIFFSNSLIDMYAKAGRVKEASNVFHGMERKNVVTWNTMIANFAQNGLELEAIRLVSDMQHNGDLPNSVTFTNVLPACGRVACLRKGKEIHARSIHVDSNFDVFVSNALTDMYTKCGQLNLARNVFEISARDEISYNILIVGYSQSPNCLESVQLFREMEHIGLNYDTISFMGVLSACANLNTIKQGKEIHGVLVRKVFHSNLFVANSILDLYTKCGRIDLARRVFDGISNKDVASWNTMILGHGMQGDLEVAINLFDKMKDERVEYDHVSYIAVLSACSHGGMVERGRKYFYQMCSQNIKPTQMHYACMVDLLGRAGLLKEAADFIRVLPVKPDANVWGALLGASRVYGNIEMGRWAAEHLFELRPEHCGYYILLSNMYAEAGRWDEANKVRELMKSRGVNKSPGCSWVQSRDKMHTFVVGEMIEGLATESCKV